LGWFAVTLVVYTFSGGCGRLQIIYGTDRVHSGLLGNDFREELPGFEALTDMLNMSARTLRRRLEKEGTSYQRIKDNARRDAAITLLSREKMTVSDVAEQVGFSDPSAFHRSFKKWTGLSPGEYR
jgi:AraC-like DNA-binding protein